tara:strand:- start:864 stop:1346 length:483 start_codon:yes stop_codon:yes gene_type:complete
VYASDPQDACNTVENEIMEWGNENNWRTIGGCISEDGEIYIVDPSDTFGGSRYKPDNDTTIQSINEMINEWLVPENYYKQQFDSCSKGENENPMEWYGAMKYCKHMFQIAKLGGLDKTFNVLHDEFFSWEFNECGVTGLDWGERTVITDKVYVVYVDMHD